MLFRSLKADIQTGATTFLPTKGKFLVETPEWQYGYSATATFGPVAVGGQYKHVGSRFATDTNDLRVPSYDLFDLDATVSFDSLGLKQTFFQLKVYNLFNARYLGSINSATVRFDSAGRENTTYFVGSPRTVQGTVRIGF